MKLVDFLDFQTNIAKNIVIDTLSAYPATPATGQIFTQVSGTLPATLTPSTTKGFFGHNGTNFVRLDNIYNSAADIIGLTAPTNGISSGTLVANNILSINASGKIIDSGKSIASLVTTSTSLVGDVTGTTGATVLSAVKGTNISISALTPGNSFYYDGTNWTNKTLTYVVSGDVNCTPSTVASTGVTTFAMSVRGLWGKTITAAPTVASNLRYDGTNLVWDSTAYLTASTGVTSVNTFVGAITITNGTGLSINNSAGVITLANTGVLSVTGTVNQITVTGSQNPVLSLPQNIHSGASPTFSAITLTGNSLSLNNVTFTASPVPKVGTDIVMKSYVDNMALGLRDFKESVSVIATSSITLSAPQTIDGIAVVAGDRVLVAGNGVNNGIYIVAAGAWTRATDFAAGANTSVTLGAYVYVESGTTNGGSGFVLSSTNSSTPSTSINVGTDTISFTKFSGGSLYTADETTLHLSGTVFNLKDTAVTAGAYGVATSGTTQAIPTFTVDAQGRLTAASSYLTTTITAVGTITTGTWNATIISLAKGGTGTDNSTGRTANTFFAAPSGASGAASWRTIVLADISTALSTWTGSTSITTVGTITTGTWNGTIIGVAKGGTGINASTAANGQLLIGNGTGFTLANITQGNGISIVNGAGSITLAVDTSKVVTRQTTTFTVLSTGLAATVSAGTFEVSGASSQDGAGGAYLLYVAHTLGVMPDNVSIINANTGEQLWATWYATSLTNYQASATPATVTTGIVIRLSNVGAASLVGASNTVLNITIES